MTKSALAILTLVLGVQAAACGSGEGATAPARLTSAPAGTQKIEVSLPVEELDLPNGLHVVFHPLPTSPGVLVYVRYEVGSKDDPPGRSGSAHLFEHLMFRGSKDTGQRFYQQWLEEVGGTSNAFTRLDSTDYYALVPPSALARAIWLESDRMAFPLAALDEDAFRQERDVVKNEAREHYENVPLGRLDTIAREAVFGKTHPYGTSPIGKMVDIDAATLAEARAFAQKFYTPQNATLVVAGSYDPPVTKELVTRYFGSIPAGKPREVRQVARPSVTAQKLAVEANVEGPAVMVAWYAPADHADGQLELAFGIEQVGAQIETRLVSEKRIARSVSYRYERGELGGLVTITARLLPGASTDAALTVIDDTVDTMSRLGRSRYTFDLLPVVKTQHLVSEVETLETLNGRAERLLDDLRWHGKVNAMQGELQQLQSVDPADIGIAVEKYLRNPPHVTLVVTQRADAPRAGRLAGSK